MLAIGLAPTAIPTNESHCVQTLKAKEICYDISLHQLQASYIFVLPLLFQPPNQPLFIVYQTLKGKEICYDIYLHQLQASYNIVETITERVAFSICIQQMFNDKLVCALDNRVQII